MSKVMQFQNVEDIVKNSEIASFGDVKRNFKYELNDKNAKSKLLKGAK